MNVGLGVPVADCVSISLIGLMNYTNKSLPEEVFQEDKT